MRCQLLWLASEVLPITGYSSRPKYSSAMIIWSFLDILQVKHIDYYWRSYFFVLKVYGKCWYLEITMLLKMQNYCSQKIPLQTMEWLRPFYGWNVFTKIIAISQWEFCWPRWWGKPLLGHSQFSNQRRLKMQRKK